MRICYPRVQKKEKFSPFFTVLCMCNNLVLEIQANHREKAKELQYRRKE
jgi:hypothetical protein